MSKKKTIWISIAAICLLGAVVAFCERNKIVNALMAFHERFHTDSQQRETGPTHPDAPLAPLAGSGKALPKVEWPKDFNPPLKIDLPPPEVPASITGPTPEKSDE